MSTAKTSDLPASSIPIFRDLAQLREWRNKAFREGKSVGFVPTMGALHEGHLSLVRRSLSENDHTIISIFVNPAQFAPHEDLDSYPRTLSQDLEVLEKESVDNKSTSAVFLPTVDVMYPSSSQDPRKQGTFVEVAGLGEVMEGASRPTFFRGVTTVVTKLFNAVQPSHAYFGQKDIQQALILRRMVGDLLFAYPTPDTLHIVPTARAKDHLALSSRNTYLSEVERKFANTLHKALKYARRAWEEGESKEKAINAALDVIGVEEIIAKKNTVYISLDYVEMNDSSTLDVIGSSETKHSLSKDDPLILSGAIWVGKTRLIDNILLGDSSRILY